MNDRVSIDLREGVADVRLNRVDKMNALDPLMFEAIDAAGEELSHMSGLRAVVLSGNGRAFCAGLDMGSFGKMADGDKGLAKDLQMRTHGDGNMAQHLIHLWRELPVPVIAAIHGVAFGGGFQLMLGADIRIATPSARFSIMEIKWGLVPDMGGVPLMRLYSRDDVIRELTYTGREFTGEEAVSLGFVTRTAEDPLAAALEMAKQIAGRNPDAIRASKRLYNLAAEASQAELLMAESVEQETLIGSANQLEAVAANFDKRLPRFTQV